jgi:hypothetical protein
VLLCSAACDADVKNADNHAHTVTETILLSYLTIVIAGQDVRDSDWEEANVQDANSGIQPMAAEPQAVDGVIDTLQGLVRQVYTKMYL